MDLRIPSRELTEEAKPGAPGDEAQIYLSIVIPLLNEAENLPELKSQLDASLSDLSRTCEIIFVDDGSSDNSFQILHHMYQEDSRVRVIRLRRNFGQTAAFSAGFDAARGEVIVTMDADLQNDPGDVVRLLEELEQGSDVVSGWRHERHDPFVMRRLPSMAANRLISVLTGVRLHDFGCSLKAYRSEVLKNLRLYGEMHRFIPALASWMGVSVTEIKVVHHPRRAGRSKYGIGRVTKVFLDLLTVKFLLDFAVRPIQIFGLAGMLFMTAGTAVGLYLTVLKLFYSQELADRPLLLLAILLVILGFQFITMGLLGELMVRIYHESQNKPTYVIREQLSRC